MHHCTEQAYQAELKLAQQARRLQQWPQAWHHAERAHILGQRRFILHLQTHWLMLKLASEQEDWSEIRGQLLRLLLTPLGHLTGRLPIGNPGSSRYPLLQPHTLPDDLREFCADSHQEEP